MCRIQAFSPRRKDVSISGPTMGCGASRRGQLGEKLSISNCGRTTPRSAGGWREVAMSAAKNQLLALAIPLLNEHLAPDFVIR